MCALCPTENAKGKLDGMECYTNSNLPKIVEIIRTLCRDTMVFLSWFIHKQILNTGGCLLLTVAVSMTSPPNKIKLSHKYLCHRVQSWDGLQAFPRDGPRSREIEQMCAQQSEVANAEM